MSTFNSLSHELMDAWLLRDEILKPEELTAIVADRMTLKMALSLLQTEGSDPYRWRFSRLKDFGFQSRLLERVRKELPDAPLGELNRAYIDEAVIPAFSRAVESRRPLLDLVRTRLLGTRVGYQRLILPQKTDGAPRWCISIVEGRFFIPSTREAKTDLTDDSIVQLLIEGHTAKEIAELLHLSPRTIEHRIDRLKERLEAKNLVHLVAKLVASQLDRKELA